MYRMVHHFLEVQDGVLDGVGKIVTRMSELKGLGITGSDEEFTGYRILQLGV